MEVAIFLGDEIVTLPNSDTVQGYVPALLLPVLLAHVANDQPADVRVKGMVEVLAAFQRLQEGVIG
jgi:hypothetical protein